MALTDATVDVGRMGEHALEASEFLKALAHEARLMILCDLLHGERRSVTWKRCCRAGRGRCRNNWRA